MFKKVMALLAKEPAAAPPWPQKKATTNVYRAVAVVPGRECCGAAKAKRHIRMLMRDAPTLPLTQCSMPQRCACHYARYEDRRDSPRRALGQHTQTVWYAGQERRVSKDRRKKT